MECEMTKIWLDQNKIPFETVDIEANPGALDLLRHYGWSSLPVIAIDDELSDESKVWSGFRVEKLEELIE